MLGDPSFCNERNIWNLQNFEIRPTSSCMFRKIIFSYYSKSKMQMSSIFKHQSSYLFYPTYYLGTHSFIERKALPHLNMKGTWGRDLTDIGGVCRSKDYIMWQRTEVCEVWILLGTFFQRVKGLCVFPKGRKIMIEIAGIKLLSLGYDLSLCLSICWNGIIEHKEIRWYITK
jgi:hypothetical protein